MWVRRQWLRDGKNWAISKAKILVEMFLTQPECMICIRATPASVLDLNFSPSSWLRWMKLFAMIWNWSLLPITFSMSLPIVLRSMIGQNNLGWSYDYLLGLWMTTIIDLLKWAGQWPRLMQAVAMLTMLLRHSSWLRMDLRWFHNSLSGPSIDKLLQLLIEHLNSSLENGAQNDGELLLISSRTLMLIYQWRAVFNVE